MKEIPERHIIPLRAKPRTCPARIMPGPLQLFVRPMQPLTRPFERAFARRYRQAGAWARWLVAFDAVAAAALVTVAVVLASVVLLPPPAPLRLSVEASAREVRAADLVGFTVRYENRSKTTLTDATLALGYPDGFRVTALTVDGGAPFEPLVAHRVIPLGEIGPGGNGAVRVSGYMLQAADAESVLRFGATLINDDGSSPIEQAEASAEVRVAGSALSLRRAGAPVDSLLRDAKAIQTVVVENAGSANVEGLSLDVAQIDTLRRTLPETFTIGPNETMVLGEYDSEQTALTLEYIERDGSRHYLAHLDPITIQRNTEGPRVHGVLARVQGGKMHARGQVSFDGLGRYRLETRYFPQPWSAVDASDLPSDAEAEGIPAESVEFVTESIAERDTRVRLTTEVAFEIPLREDMDTSELTIRVVVFSCFVDSDDCAWSSSERVPVAPPGPTLSAELRYYTAEGEQLGRGPLPPRVEEKTEYWLVAQIATAGRTLVDAELAATFAPDVTWAAKASTAIVGAGSPRGATALRWRLGEVTSSVASPSTAAFAVAYRPRPDAVGREPVLVESLLLRGRDAETGQPVELRLGPFTTAVPHDLRALEKGTRVEPPLE